MNPDTQQSLEPEHAEAAAPDASPADATAERRRRRRRKTGHRHRDLSPEEDNRRRQRSLIVVIVPAILAVLGAIVWMAGAWNQDAYQHQTGLILAGKSFLGLGGGVLGVILLRQWGKRLRGAIRERLNPPMDTSLHDHHHPRGSSGRTRKRRHRSARPSAFRAE